jgi:hypothetical protein
MMPQLDQRQAHRCFLPVDVACSAITRGARAYAAMCGCSRSSCPVPMRPRRPACAAAPNSAGVVKRRLHHRAAAYRRLHDHERVRRVARRR